MEPCIRWGSDPPREEALLRRAGAIGKHCKIQLRNNGRTLTVVQHTNENLLVSAMYRCTEISHLEQCFLSQKHAAKIRLSAANDS